MTAPVDPTVVTDPRPDDQLIWTTTDGATIYITVKRITRHGVIYLRCHQGDRTWTRRHEGPLFPSMKRGEWTAADLLDQL